MSDTVFVAIVGAISSLVFFFLGKKAEKQKQSLLVRAQLLEPVVAWLGGAEKMVGILSDTVSTLALGHQLPVTYNLEERRKAAQFMTENTNQVLGILSSKILYTAQTGKIAKEMEATIKLIDSQIKFTLLPLENELLELANRHKLDEAKLRETGTFKLMVENQLQRAYELIAKMKTAFT